MIISQERYLLHYGVQGMKWGVRRETNRSNVASLRGKGLSRRQAKNTVRYQNRVDRQKMAATGRQGQVSVLQQLNNRMVSNQMLSLGTVVRHPLSTRNAANRQLQVNQQVQTRIAAGERRVTAALIRLNGVSIADIDYSL